MHALFQKADLLSHEIIGAAINLTEGNEGNEGP